MRWGRLIKLREKTNGKKTRPSTLTTGKLSGSKKCWPSLLFCCLWIFQELLQQSLSWPKMFAHSWSGLQVRDSFFSPISGKLRAFAIYQKTSETSMESAIGWRTCAILHSFLSLSFQNSRWQNRYCPELHGSGKSFWKIESGTRISTSKISNRRTRQRTRQRTGEPDKKPTWNWTKKSDKNREKTRTRNRTEKPTEIQPKKNRTKKKWTKSGQKRGLSNTPLFFWTHNELTPRLTSDIFRKNVIFPKPDQYSFIEPDHDDRKRMGMKVNIVY